MVLLVPGASLEDECRLKLVQM